MVGTALYQCNNFDCDNQKKNQKTSTCNQGFSKGDQASIEDKEINKSMCLESGMEHINGVQVPL